MTKSRYIKGRCECCERDRSVDDKPSGHFLCRSCRKLVGHLYDLLADARVADAACRTMSLNADGSPNSKPVQLAILQIQSAISSIASARIILTEAAKATAGEVEQ